MTQTTTPRFVAAWHTCAAPMKSREPHSPEQTSAHRTLREAVEAAVGAGVPSGRSVYINWEALSRPGGIAYLFTPNTRELTRYRGKRPGEAYSPPGVRISLPGRLL